MLSSNSASLSTIIKMCVLIVRDHYKHEMLTKQEGLVNDAAARVRVCGRCDKTLFLWETLARLYHIDLLALRKRKLVCSVSILLEGVALEVSDERISCCVNSFNLEGWEPQLSALLVLRHLKVFHDELDLEWQGAFFCFVLKTV